jgi:hypothetical protein
LDFGAVVHTEIFSSLFRVVHDLIFRKGLASFFLNKRPHISKDSEFLFTGLAKMRFVSEVVLTPFIVCFIDSRLILDISGVYFYLDVVILLLVLCEVFIPISGHIVYGLSQVLQALRALSCIKMADVLTFIEFLVQCVIKPRPSSLIEPQLIEFGFVEMTIFNLTIIQNETRS